MDRLYLASLQPFVGSEINAINETHIRSGYACDTFRGGEAAFTFARWLAALRHVFGIKSLPPAPQLLAPADEAAVA